jgi:hypothetical protein
VGGINRQVRGESARVRRSIDGFVCSMHSPQQVAPLHRHEVINRCRSDAHHDGGLGLDAGVIAAFAAATDAGAASCSAGPECPPTSRHDSSRILRLYCTGFCTGFDHGGVEVRLVPPAPRRRCSKAADVKHVRLLVHSIELAAMGRRSPSSSPERLAPGRASDKKKKDSRDKDRDRDRRDKDKVGAAAGAHVLWCWGRGARPPMHIHHNPTCAGSRPREA